MKKLILKYRKYKHDHAGYCMIDNSIMELFATLLFAYIGFNILNIFLYFTDGFSLKIVFSFFIIGAIILFIYWKIMMLFDFTNLEKNKKNDDIKIKELN